LERRIKKCLATAQDLKRSKFLALAQQLRAGKGGHRHLVRPPQGKTIQNVVVEYMYAKKGRIQAGENT
jgi:hypothetical protein